MRECGLLICAHYGRRDTLLKLLPKVENLTFAAARSELSSGSKARTISSIPATMETFKDYFNRVTKSQNPDLLLEYECYKLIPDTKNSYREDPTNTSTLTIRHSHVYAKPKGKGKHLYAVNLDGSGHDGYSGIRIPASHAEYFRERGYSVPENNVLEAIELERVSHADFVLLLG